MYFTILHGGCRNEQNWAELKKIAVLSIFLWKGTLTFKTREIVMIKFLYYWFSLVVGKFAKAIHILIYIL